MNKQSKFARSILDTALTLAEKSPWEKIRLHDIAGEMGCSLDDIRAHYAQKEELIDAWFDRADRAMLRDAEHPGFDELSPHEKLERVVMSWLGALAVHQEVTRQMILGRLEPGHLHIQFAGLLRVSRTVQWMREAAQRDASYLNRALEESLLTGIYLLTFARWMTDHSEGFARTRQLLHRLLGRSAFLLHVADGELTSPAPPTPARPPHHQHESNTHH